MLSSEQIKLIFKLLRGNDFKTVPDWQVDVLSGDGSQRRFFRVCHKYGGRVLAVLPSLEGPAGMAEARACHGIGTYLYSQGVPVPKILAFEESSGTVLFEDLGDIKLHDLVTKSGLSPDIIKYYQEAVLSLVRLQVPARDGFDKRHCWETAQYDRNVMLDKESGYFFREYWQEFLSGDDRSHDLKGEFHHLADQVAQEPSDFILHRDFQSRNLMVHKGKIRIIDFQGARLGPLGYDLASLLIDPYVSLPIEFQDDLLSCYFSLVEKYIPINFERFCKGYYFLALQRNLQILGAFSFLSQKRKKSFFIRYIKPAAESLNRLLQMRRGAEFYCLRNMVEESLPILDKKLASL